MRIIVLGMGYLVTIGTLMTAGSKIIVKSSPKGVNMVSNARHEEMKEYNEQRLKTEVSNVEFWRGKAFAHGQMALDTKKLEAQCEVYKAIIDRLMGGDVPSDNKFMFEGKLYIPREYNLVRELEKSDVLTVEFVRADENLYFVEKGVTNAKYNYDNG